MTLPTLTERDGVHVLHLGEDENRFSPAWLSAVEDALDRVVARPAPLVTVGDGKQYSSGLDLAWVEQHPEEFPAYVARVEALFARVLGLGVPTVAALNGHAFGAGALLAMAHDRRVMRSDRGYFCFPEVDIRVPFSSGMAALVVSKLDPRAANEAMTTGRRYGGEEAAAAGIVDATAADAAVLADAVALAAPLAGKDPETLAAIKAAMYADALTRLGASA